MYDTHKLISDRYKLNKIISVTFKYISFLVFLGTTSVSYGQSDRDMKNLYTKWSKMDQPWSFVRCKDGSFECGYEDRNFPEYEGFDLSFLHPNEKLIIYIQSKIQSPLDGNKNVWSLVDYTYSNSSEKIVKTLYSIDCKNNKYSIIQQEQEMKSGYSRTLGPQGKSFFISPGSFEDKLKKQLCKIN